MIAVILFVLLLAQRHKLRKSQGNLAPLMFKRINQNMNIGIVLLGVTSILNIYFNVTMHRGWWNGDFFSPFFN
jgi:putative copper export protein